METGAPGSIKAVRRSVYIVTAVVCLAVLLLNQKVLPRSNSIPLFVYRLPFMNACINGTCSVLLVISFLAIRARKIALHRTLNITAFVLSSIFLVSYVTTHYFIADTKFGDVDHNGVLSASESLAVAGTKPFYLFLLLTHILLAVAVLPLVLLSLYYGLTDQRPSHQRISRWTFPVWLYVTITGVIVYRMISPYYNF